MSYGWHSRTARAVREAFSVIRLLMAISLFFLAAVSLESAARSKERGWDEAAFALTKRAWRESYFLEKQGNILGALKMLESTDPIAAWECPWHVREGWLRLQVGHVQASYAAYKKALSVEPNNVDALTGILSPLIQMNRWQEVEARAKTLVKTFPSLYSGHYHLNLVHQNAQNWSQLIRAADESLAFFPLSADFRVFKARGLDGLGDVDLALIQYQQVMLIVPDNAEAKSYIARYSLGGF